MTRTVTTPCFASLFSLAPWASSNNTGRITSSGNRSLTKGQKL
jgi:hypothetical protein